MYFFKKNDRIKFIPLFDKIVKINRISLGGVLSSLRSSCSSSSEYLNEFIATGSSSRAGDPSNVFNPDDDTRWMTNSGSVVQWIQIEMKNKFITMTGYKIRTFSSGTPQPKSWKLEGKLKSSDPWKVIDERSSVSETNEKGVTVTFTNNVLPSCTFKIFRFKTSELWSSPKYLGLSEIDFIGKTSNKNPDYQTRKYYRGKSPKLLSFLIICAVKEL